MWEVSLGDQDEVLFPCGGGVFLEGGIFSFFGEFEDFFSPSSGFFFAEGVASILEGIFSPSNFVGELALRRFSGGFSCKFPPLGVFLKDEFFESFGGEAEERCLEDLDDVLGGLRGAFSGEARFDVADVYGAACFRTASIRRV